MGYEDLLNDAYEKVTVCADCAGRFEIKKAEGHHEGNKTVVTNFAQIVSCLRRDKDHLARFLFRALASSGFVKEDRLIFDRKISSKDINDKIEKYANEFVLCSNCKKPDTELAEENGKLYVRCLACGKKTEVHRV